jgi:tagatose 1,6-diphosphate aldolase
MTKRSLRGISDEAGRFSILAIDHRDSMRRFLEPSDPGSIDPAKITALKVELVRGLADLATGVMLEPEFSIPQVIDSGALPDGVGFLAALESQGYLDDPGANATTILEGWSIEQAMDAGATAAKLLLPYHPDRPMAITQEAMARDVLAECRTVGLPLVLEPLFYDLEDPEDRGRVVIATARTFAAMGPDLLKLPYPGSVEACEEITAVASMPWTMLSGGGTFEDFAEQFAVAVAAGCSGFMVGRALWGEAARAPAEERAAIIQALVRERFDRLLAINATG